MGECEQYARKYIFEEAYNIHTRSYQDLPLGCIALWGKTPKVFWNALSGSNSTWTWYTPVCKYRTPGQKVFEEKQNENCANAYWERVSTVDECRRYALSIGFRTTTKDGAVEGKIKHYKNGWNTKPFHCIVEYRTSGQIKQVAYNKQKANHKHDDPISNRWSPVCKPLGCRQ